MRIDILLSAVLIVLCSVDAAAQSEGEPVSSVDAAQAEGGPLPGDAAEPQDDAGSPESQEVAAVSPAAEAPPESEFVGIVLPDDYGASTDIPPDATPPATVAPSVSEPESGSAMGGYRQPTLMEPQKEEAEVFPWFTVVPEIGYIFFPKSRMEVNGFKASVEARNGFAVKLHFDLGGDGLAFEMAPLFAIESGGITPDGGGFGELSSIDLSTGGSFKSVGAQTAILYRFSVKKKFFPHLGIGFHGTYLLGKHIDYGAELYGRIPVGFTAYFSSKAAFVFDMGFMFGVTGVRTPLKLPAMLDTMPEDLRAGLEGADTQADFNNWYLENRAEVDAWISDPNSGLPEGYNASRLAADLANDQLGESIRFGRGFGFDVSIGIRFP